MVFVQRLGILLPAVDCGCKVLSDANDRLQQDEDVCDKTEDGVRGLEVGAAMVDLVVFNDDETGDGREDGHVVECCVRVGALFLLFGGVGGLEDENGLDEEEEGGRVEELQTMH